MALPVSQRHAEIRSRKFCINCLRSSSHASSKCTSGQCKVCQAKQYATHMPSAADPSTSNIDKEVAPKAIPPPSLLSNYALESSNNDQVMLSTAVVFICSSDGSRRACRALLRIASEFRNQEICGSSRFRNAFIKFSICGVNGTVTSTNHMVGIKLQSRLNSYTMAIECIVTDRITGKIPTFSLGRDKFNLPRNIRLADPRFHTSSDIDLLIGVDLFWNLICVGQVKSSDKHSTLQKTRLG